MKIERKTKYLISLAAVLLLGFFIGFLVNGRITHARIDRMRNFYTEPGFNRVLMRIIRPTPEQRKQLQPVLKKYARQNRARLMEFRKKQAQSFDSLVNEIKPLLTEQQVLRLEQAKRRRIMRMKGAPYGKHQRRGKMP